VLNRKCLGIFGGTAAAGIFWIRRLRSRRRTLATRLRAMRAGAILMSVGIATQSRAVRSFSRKLGKTLIGKSFSFG
jgi:hypothetical protein